MFAEGLDTPTSERPVWIERQCEGLPSAVRDELESLLSAHDDAGDFLRDPTVDPAALAAATAAGAGAGGAEVDLVPATIGTYALGRELGRGGFGTVYLAKQTTPLERTVALKLINPGMDTRQVVARFEAERQTLARLNHPNIAQVFDAGATPGRRPYFVMEWVDGPPMVAYADRRRLPVRGRLELFVPVCRAIQHAHQKGVIHRDLKPNNVLVAELKSGPLPKVIDFGVAKAVGADEDAGADAVGMTAAHQLIGTPQYMSPEQADPAAGPLDTRTDVFGLGVLLYELLTGLPPFDAAVLRKVAPANVAELVRKRRPMPPSRRVLQDGPGGAADRRRLSRELRGDLDWIVARATENEPARRYATADALAEDVLRYLVGEPVLAGPPSRVYRARKFVARNRGMVAAAAAVSVATLGGGTASTLLWFDAAKARDEAVTSRVAEASQRLAAEQQRALAVAGRTEAEAHAARLQDAQSFLYHLIPINGRPGDPVPPSPMLDFVAARLDAGALRRRPELEAPLRLGIAKTYLLDPAKIQAAHHHFTATLACLEASGPPASPVVYVSCLHNLAIANQTLGDLPAAEAAFVRGLEYCRAAAEELHDPTFPGTTRVFLVDLLIAEGKDREAAEALAVTLDEADRLAAFTPDAVTLCERVEERANRLSSALTDADVGLAGDARAIARRARALIERRSANLRANPSGDLVYPPTNARPTR